MALWRDGRAVSQTVNDARSHAERLPLEAMTWLAAHDVALQDIDIFVVVAGPGSFTGLRVGVSAVQGWALATGKPVAPVPTLAALAASMTTDARRDTVIVPCMDGLRSEVFIGAWCGGECIANASVGQPADAIAAVSAVADGRPVVIGGDGAEKYRAEWLAAGWDVVVPSVTIAEAAAAIVAAGQVRPGPPHAVRPNYVRRTDAEIIRERKGPRP